MRTFAKIFDFYYDSRQKSKGALRTKSYWTAPYRRRQNGTV